jgi:hypothetical protein
MRGKMLMIGLEPGIPFLKVDGDSLTFLGLEASGVKNKVQILINLIDVWSSSSGFG